MQWCKRVSFEKCGATESGESIGSLRVTTVVADGFDVLILLTVLSVMLHYAAAWCCSCSCCLVVVVCFRQLAASCCASSLFVNCFLYFLQLCCDLSLFSLPIEILRDPVLLDYIVLVKFKIATPVWVYSFSMDARCGQPSCFRRLLIDAARSPVLFGQLHFTARATFPPIAIPPFPHVEFTLLCSFATVEWCYMLDSIFPALLSQCGFRQ